MNKPSPPSCATMRAESINAPYAARRRFKSAIAACHPRCNADGSLIFARISSDKEPAACCDEEGAGAGAAAGTLPAGAGAFAARRCSSWARNAADLSTASEARAGAGASDAARAGASADSGRYPLATGGTDAGATTRDSSTRDEPCAFPDVRTAAELDAANDPEASAASSVATRAASASSVKSLSGRTIRVNAISKERRGLTEERNSALRSPRTRRMYARRSGPNAAASFAIAGRAA